MADYRKNGSNNGQGSSYREDPMKEYENIIKKDDIYGEEYVDAAEKVMQKVKEYNDNKKKKKKKSELLTTSKIRNIMSMMAEIYNEAMENDESLSGDTKSRIEYLRMRIVYEAGRENAVKVFVTAAKLLDGLKDVKGSKERFVQFYHYMEALVAYFKYYGGQEQ